MTQDISPRVPADVLKKVVGQEHIGRELEYFAPAKINLRLKVTGRRDDGYHLLSMLNVSASLGDDLKLRLKHDLGVDLEVSPAGAIKGATTNNLIVKAWNGFWEEFALDGAPCGLSVKLDKRIPIGGGLGGGSSDAGAVLRFLRDVFSRDIQDKLGISLELFEQRMTRVALKVGADVPYAYCGGNCWVGGIGESVARVLVDKAPANGVFIVMPPVSVPTIEFYSFYRKMRPVIEPFRDLVMEELVRGESPSSLNALIENDFEPEIVKFRPEVGEALRLARKFFPQTSSITGSGAAIFSLIQGEAPEVAQQFEDTMRQNGMLVHRVLLF
jgi:4-diphosphocytidyl-2-C-methyl-D-erythritol kinase